MVYMYVKVERCMKTNFMDVLNNLSFETNLLKVLKYFQHIKNAILNKIYTAHIGVNSILKKHVKHTARYANEKRKVL